MLTPLPLRIQSVRLMIYLKIKTSTLFGIGRSSRVARKARAHVPFLHLPRSNTRRRLPASKCSELLAAPPWRPAASSNPWRGYISSLSSESQKSKTPSLASFQSGLGITYLGPCRSRHVRHFRLVAEKREREAASGVESGTSRAPIVHRPRSDYAEAAPAAAVDICEMSGRPAKYRADEKDTLLEIASEGDAIDSALLSASRFARAPRSAACRGNAEKHRYSGLHSRCLELASPIPSASIRRSRELGLERNLDRSPRALPPANSMSAASPVDTRQCQLRELRRLDTAAVLNVAGKTEPEIDLRRNYKFISAKVPYVALVSNYYYSPRWIILRLPSSKSSWSSTSGVMVDRRAISSNGGISEEAEATASLKLHDNDVVARHAV